MTLTAILADLYRRLRYTPTPPQAVITRLTAFVNETQRELLAMPGIARLRDDPGMAITALANVAVQGLPPAIARVKKIVDRGNNHELDQVPLSELRMQDPAMAFVGGFPLRYAVVGYQPVSRQPSAATGLWVASSAAGDTTQKAYVESMTTGAYPNQSITAGTALNGTTRVAIGALTSHIEVTKFYIDAVGVGSISLYDAASSGNELARIPIGLTSARYLGVAWHPIQTADVTLYADITRAVFDLVNGTDEPMIPPDFHYVVSLGARVREYEFIDDSRIGTARSDYTKGQAALRSWVLNDGDRIASLRPMPVGWSSLGAMYPAGS